MKNGFFSIKPSKESKTTEWFCDFDSQTVGYPRGCSENFPHTNGSYQIKMSESVDHFQVSCQYTHDKVVTVFHHDSENEVEVTCEDRKCHKRNIAYRAELDQLVLVIDNSEECQQYFKYRCRGSMLVRDNYAGWMSRDGTIKNYWAADNHQYGYCQCGVEGNCINTRYKCNCDQNGNIATSDDGYFKYKPHLPLRQLMFGDTGASSESGFHTLGPLMCFTSK